MIITKTQPYTKEEIKKLQEVFGSYIKTVIDTEGRVCSAGMDRHFEGEEILLKMGSVQYAIWGGGIDVETKDIDYNSFINIRPSDNNRSNEIQSDIIQKKYRELTEYFFKNIL